MQLRLLMGVHLILVLLLHGLAPAPMDGTTTVAATKYVILPVGLLVRICKLVQSVYPHFHDRSLGFAAAYASSLQPDAADTSQVCVARVLVCVVKWRIKRS